MKAGSVKSAAGFGGQGADICIDGIYFGADAPPMQKDRYAEYHGVLS